MNKKTILVAAGFFTAAQAMAGGGVPNKGFIEDSHMDMLLRNAWIKRDYRDGAHDKAEWGQGFIAILESGFTQGPVGFGADGIAQYAVRLDGGRGYSGAGGIDFFEQNSEGKAKSQLAKFGARAKMRISNTVLSYGTQRPQLPILNYDGSRLLYETYTGTVINSKEIEGLEINAGYLNDEQRKSNDRHNAGLKNIAFGGASYQFNENWSGAYYASHNQDVMNKQYYGLNYTRPLFEKQSFVLDFNGYDSRLNKQFANQLNTGRNNNIWSLAASYIYDIHTFKLAYQQSRGSTGYNYGGYRDADGTGDGGNTIWLANSYWSDFNGEDERSWQAAYALDFAGLGVPGLSWNIAYVRGDNIKTAATNSGKERELFNQLQYQVQDGPAKDLKFKVRYSVLRVSETASDYNVSGNEVRVLVEYPFNIF